MINWKVRIKNRHFWLSLIPACIVLIQVIASLFGYQIDLGEIGNKLITAVNAVFVVLSLIGIVNDPTTEGITDSKQAMTYEQPKKRDGSIW